MSYYAVPNESESVLSGLSLYYDSMYIGSGGTAADTTLTHGGSMYVSSGGTATETTLYYGGSMYVCSSGLADNTTVNGGTLIVSNSGLADNTTINTGVLYIYSGGTADNTTANLGGGLNISSGGTATNILENGGVVTVYSGATATFTPNVLNDLVASDSCHITIHSGTTAVNANLMNASMFVYSGGTATGTTIVNWGLLRVNNGLAENTVVNSAGGIEVSSGGVAKNTTVNSAGSICVNTGANADGVSIASGGYLFLYGGTATGVAAEDGAIFYVYLDSDTCLTGTSGGKEISISEGNLNGLEFGSSGYLYVYNYVTATSAVIGPGARMFIASYGSAVDIVENGGNVILNGGNAARVTYKNHEFKDVVLEDSGTYNGTTATVHSGTTATNTTIGGSAVMCVYSGGSVNSATVSAITISSGSSQYLRGGNLFVYSGGIADGVIRASELGKVTISSGAVVADGLKLVEDGGGFELDSDVEAAIVSRIIPNEFGGRTLSGLVTVHSGTTATDVTFTNGAFHLYSGGVLNNFTLSGGNLVVHSGVELVSAVECGEYRGGVVTVASGAVVTGISKCDASINGTVINAIVGDGDRSYIRFDVGSGGKLISATALQSGGIFVGNGGLVEDSIIEYGWGAVYSGGSVKNMTLKDGEYDIYGGVFDGGQGYGYLSVDSGGSLKNLTLSGGWLSVRDGTATDFTISDGSLGVYGGTATDFTLAGSASISFSVDPTDGTYISGTIMKGETPTTILIQDGKVKDLNMRGTIYLGNGGTADNITFSGGNAVISSGGTATNLKFIGMDSGGGVYVDSYGYLNGAIFESGTGLTMSYYASAANVSALGGDIRMVDTCRIDNALITSGGVMSMLAYEGDAPVAVGTVISHGIVTSTYYDSYTDIDSTWTEDKGGSLLAYWNAVFSDTTVWEKGTATVGSYGHASNTTVHSGGSMVISARGEASGVTVSSGGSLQIDYSGTATDVTVLSGGRVYMVIDPDTHISGTYEGSAFAVDGTLTSAIGPGFSYEVASGGAITASKFALDEGGMLTVCSGATFQGDLTVNRGCEAHIYYGTNVSGTVLENGGWVYISDDANITFLSNTLNNLQLTSGYSATVHSKTVASNTLVQGVVSEDDGKWSELAVFGGVVYDTDVRENGYLYVSSGGSAFRTRVYTGGELYLYESSFASDAVATGSNALIEVGYSCTAVSATVNDHASMYVWNCGLVSSTTVSGGAIMGVYGGSAIDTVVLGGTMAAKGYYYSSGVCNASNTTVGAGGSMAVWSYGVASDTMVKAGGSMAVYLNGSAVNTMIEAGGSLHVSGSGNAYDTTVEADAGMAVYDWGCAYNTTVKTGGVMHVSSGGYAETTTVEADGFLHVSSSGYVYETTVAAGGALNVSSGGSAYNTTVKTGGDLHVSSGGSACGVTVEANGVLHVESGGVLMGTISVADGGTIAVDGGIVAFDLTYSSPGTNILVDNMAAITGNPNYRIAVYPGYQTDGVYTFASGAENFTGTMTLVRGDDVALGTLSVGEAVEAGGKYFLLTNDGGSLSLMVSAYPLSRDDGPDDHWNNYVYDKKNKTAPENPNLGDFVVNELAEGVTEVFVDRKYSVVVDGMHNFAGKVQGFEPYEDDLADYAKIELATGAKLAFDIDSHIAGKFVIYSYDEAKKKLTALQTTSVKLNKDGSAKTTATKEKFFEAGTYYVSMQVADPKKKYAPDGFYNVMVGSKTVYFKDDDSGWNNWLYDKKKSPADNSANLNSRWIDYAGQNIQADNTGYYAGEGYYQNFVGFGDDTDFVKIRLSSAANLHLNLRGAGAADGVKNSGALKVVLYSFDSKKNKMTALQTTSVKAADLIAGTANTKLKLLEAGDYYISVTASNAKKGDKVYYTTSVGSNTVFFTDGDGWNDYVYDKKNAESPVNTDVTEAAGFTVTADCKGNTVNFDFASYSFRGKSYTGFAGHGDTTDFVKINVAKAGTASFKVEASDAAKIEIWSFDSGKLKMKSLQSTALKKGEVVDGVQMYTAETKAYAFKEPGEYYLSITSTNASKGGSAYYNVTLLDTDIADDAGDADALAMPETSDSLAAADGLSFGQYDADALADASAFDQLAAFDDASAWQSVAKLA